MTYLSARQKRYGKIVRVVLLIATVLLLTVFWKQARSFLYPVFIPFAKGYAVVRDAIVEVPNTISIYFSTRQEDEAKIRALSLEVERLENEITRIQRNNPEVEDATSTEKLFIQGSIAMYPVITDITRLYSTITLSRGFVDGITEGKVVYIKGYQAVGLISQVYKSTSMMTLYSAPGKVTQAIIKESQIMVSLEGQGGGSFTIDVPKTIDIQVGQTVYLAEDQTMIVGTVSSVRNDPQDTFVRAYVRSPYSPTKANTFYVTQ
jgi:cell shape-determining protein MreC